MIRTSFMTLLMLTLIGLSACDSSRSERNVIRQGGFDPYNQTVVTDGATIPTLQDDHPSIMDHRYAMPADGIMQNLTRGKIAILLPLSGQHQAIGQALLQSAQLALFDMKQTGVELLPFDTRGTSAGATMAVNEAARQGAQLVLGPVFADAVAAAGIAAAQKNLTVIGFTTDWSKAGRNIYTLGILPFDQGARLAQYAAQSGKKRVAILDPRTDYGNAVISAFAGTAQSQGISIAQTIPVSTNATDLRTVLAPLAARKGQFDAILMPFGNPQASTIAATLNGLGLGADTVLWMGTGIWDDPAIIRNAAMNNAVFAAPSPELRYNFETNYQSLYGTTPPRIASLAYDATALAISLLGQNSGAYQTALLNPNGFAGIDGIFRFQSNGLAQRGLAIHRIRGGQSMIVDQAPKSFLTPRGDVFAR